MIAFIGSLRITSGAHAGRRFRLRPWQREIVEAIYREHRGRRIVRQALVTMGRKNGKTALAAALALCHLVGPEAVPRGQVVSAAADRNQAGHTYREMKAMILADPELADRVIVRDFMKQLEDSETGSTFEALSSDAKKAHGRSPSFAVLDELAQWSGRELYDALTTGTGAHHEPLQIVISTQSADPHSCMAEVTNYARQVRDGVIDDPAFSPHIFEVPLDADPFDERNWPRANPGLGDFRSLTDMRTLAAKARKVPALESAFRCYFLNTPVDADDRFISGADWDACAGTVDAEALRGRPCWAGLDLGSVSDLTALVLFFAEDGGAVLPFFWVPADAITARAERDKVPYPTWHAQRLLATTPGRSVDRKAVALRLAEIAAEYDLRGVAFDRWRIDELKRILSEEGIDLPLVEWGQGFKDMAPAVDVLESAILDRKLAHGGNPILRWNASNVRLETDAAGSRKLSKAKSIEKIDGLVALAMAMGLHAKQAPAVTYDFDRPLVISA